MESSGGVQTLRNVSAYHAWHFDATFVSRDVHTRANMQKAPGHGHFLEMKNSVYHCPYDLVDNKVNAIYIVHKIRDYDSTGTEHNYLFSCGTSDNHPSWCMLPQGWKDNERIWYSWSSLITIWIFRISLPVTIIHVERINRTLSV